MFRGSACCCNCHGICDSGRTQWNFAMPCVCHAVDTDRVGHSFIPWSPTHPGALPGRNLATWNHGGQQALAAPQVQRWAQRSQRHLSLYFNWIETQGWWDCPQLQFKETKAFHHRFAGRNCKHRTLMLLLIEVYTVSTHCSLTVVLQDTGQHTPWQSPGTIMQGLCNTGKQAVILRTGCI